MNKVRIGLVSLMAVASGAAVMLSPAAAQASAAACSPGEVCVWSGKDATGIMCSWDGDDPDWLGGSVQCTDNGKPYPNGKPFKVNSLMNHGYPGAYDQVQFYKYAGYSGRLYDPLPPTGKVYNVDNMTIRSHIWVDFS